MHGWGRKGQAQRPGRYEFSRTFSAALLALLEDASSRALKDACEAHVLKQALTAAMSCAVLAIDGEYTHRVHLRLKQRMSRPPPSVLSNACHAPSLQCHALSWRLIVSIQIECTSVLSAPAAPQVSAFELLYYFVLVKQVN
jgi:hypothetical protein